MMHLKSYHILLGLICMWCVLVFLPPMLGGSPAVVYHFFSHICHQDASRSIAISGYPLAVCARCSMIYVGFFVGAIVVGLWPGPSKATRLKKSITIGKSLVTRRRFRFWFIAIALPMVMDVGLDAVGLHHTTMVTRIVTGLMFGMGSGLLLTPLFIEGTVQLLSAITARKRRHGTLSC